MAELRADTILISDMPTGFNIPNTVTESAPRTGTTTFYLPENQLPPEYRENVLTRFIVEGNQEARYLVPSDGSIADGDNTSIYKAFDRKLGIEVAIKVIHSIPQAKNESEVVEPFLPSAVQRETKIMAKASGYGNYTDRNEHVVQIFDHYISTEGEQIIVMEIMNAKQTLRSIMNAGQMPIDHVKQVITQLGETIDRFANHGLMHNDLKPENIFIVPQPDGSIVVKITDFGISSTKEMGKFPFVAGTAGYLSPERTIGFRTTRQSEIFSLAAIFYEMLAGEYLLTAMYDYVPNLAASILASISKINGVSPKARGILAESVLGKIKNIDAVVTVLDKALQNEPEGRYQTATEFTLALAAALQKK